MNPAPEQIPVNDDTKPDAAVVHLTRWAIERAKRNANERDKQRPPPPKDAA